MRASPRDDLSPGDPVSEYRAETPPAPWDILFRDGEWHQVQVRAWWLNRHGRQVVQFEWHAGGDTWGDSYLAEPGKMRKFR